MAMSPRLLYIGLLLNTLPAFGTNAANATDERLPIHVPTDGAKWFGNDGTWSTATLRLGNPAQAIYLLASTGSSITTAVGSIWCNDENSGFTCDSRGQSFNAPRSTTWQEIGQYELGIRPELVEEHLQYTTKDLGYGEFGRDSIKIGSDDSRMLKVDGLTIAVLNDTTQLLGTLGLGINSRSFTEEEQYPSLLSKLYDSGTIPSRSWGYTAGNYHKTMRTPTDVVLGGRNLGRYTANNVTFQLDANRNPSVFVDTVSVSATGIPPWGAGAQTLMLEPAMVQIDSSTPFLWLPEGACREFERALGLAWNDTTNLYLFNDTNVYDGLLKLNMTFKFTLASEPGSSKVVNIEVPYSSLDLDITWPYINTTEKQKYFPLKRATNEQQYTLGRAFLQESYLVVDYDRGNFSVHQAIFPPGNDEIVEILHPDNVEKDEGPKHNGLPVGTITGIAIGSSVTVIALIAAGFYFYDYRKKQDERKRHGIPMDGQQHIWETYGDSTAIKLSYTGLQTSTAEMGMEAMGVEEMGAGEMAAAEMATEGLERSELPAVNLDPAELSGNPTESSGRQRFSWESLADRNTTNTASPFVLEYEMVPVSSNPTVSPNSPKIIAPRLGSDMSPVSLDSGN